MRLVLILIAAASTLAACDSSAPTELIDATGAPDASAPDHPRDGGIPTEFPDVGNPTDADAGTPACPCDPADVGDAGGSTLSDEELVARLASLETLTVSSFQAAHCVPFAAGLPFAPTSATALDLLQASSLSLDADELAVLSAHGFVLSERQRFMSMTQGLELIYMNHLPVYISADAILDTIHRSYDDVLMVFESAVLAPSLTRLLSGMRTNLASGAARALGPQAAADADLYLAVALGLLDNSAIPPVAGADPQVLASLRAAIATQQGMASMELFGSGRDIDLSQFKPRGHYTRMGLSHYFQAMMWLGRIDLRLIETLEDGSQVFRRRQFDAALALHAALDDAALAEWRTLDTALEIFIGESDSMSFPQFGPLFAALGVSDAAQTRSLDDATIERAIAEGGFGAQRIASQIMFNGVDGTLPLSSSFLISGQRYVIDSHVFSNVVYDRARHGALYRMMPNPLDIAYAALGNDQAAALLGPELAAGDYSPDLESMRVLVDAHPSSFWEASLYNHWLRALRALSPKAHEIADPTAGLPSVARTEAWGRRLLNTQLASWAQLRHDTLLYAKQSYTSGVECEYPDAYVDPYPELFDAIQAYAERGRALISLANGTFWANEIDRYFTSLSQAGERLADMARRQRAGEPLTADQLAWVNQAVQIEQYGCVPEQSRVNGWYRDLVFNADGYLPIDLPWSFDPTIADVHTQPTDAAGNIVGRVLHVGSGAPRLLVATVDTCSGPRAYVGVASSYYEKITDDFERLDDEAWSGMISRQSVPDVSWMQDLVVGAVPGP